MVKDLKKSKCVLYVFAGEKAQGAEIVIERLMMYNKDNVAETHLILSPGDYATQLLKAEKPYVITLCDDLKKLNRPSTNAFKFYLKALRNYFSVSYKVHKYIKDNNIDLVHANTIVPAAYLLPLILFSRFFSPSVRFCWSDHDLKYFSKMENILAHACARSYHHTLVVSGAVKRKYPAGYKSVTVLYNGLDPNLFQQRDSFRNIARKQWEIADKSIVIGIAASINPDKGQLQLIELFKALHAQYAEMHLVIAGSYANQFPEYTKAVKNAVEATRNVLYIGFISDVVTFYNGCDIVINNSNNFRSESLGTTIYEAMSCEKIVLAADTGGTPEIITDKQDGFLFEPENSVDIREKLSYIISNWSSMIPIQIAARGKVIKKFHIVQMINKYNNIVNN